MPIAPTKTKITSDIPETSVVGKSEPKVDALKLAKGNPAFVDDMSMRNMLYAKLLTSPHAHARISDIDDSDVIVVVGSDMIREHHNEYLRIRKAVISARKRESDWRCRPNGKRRVSAWPIIEVALLRHPGGLGFAEIGTRLETTPGMARIRLVQHRRLLEADAEYARRAADLASASLRVVR